MPTPEHFTPAILTGSHAYGTPKFGSDIDLVVFTDKETIDKIRLINETRHPPDPMAVARQEAYPEPTVSMRFGDLNLLLCSDIRWYRSWVAVTKDLVAESKDNGPVTRDHAVEKFSSDRGMLNSFEGYRA